MLMIMSTGIFFRNMMEKLGYGIKWRSWMKVCVFTNNLFVLVNGSPIRDFKIERGLGQGDPLSPFLFTMVTEGLTGLINRVIEIREFMGFKVNNNVEYRSL